VRLLPRDAKVCELLDPDTNWWNTSMVQNVFNAEEAQVICSMGVSPRTRHDHLVWAGTKQGDYTVRSAYHMVKENGIRVGGSCSNAQDMAALWKGIWKIKCARVVKTFLWQAYNNILPTKELLFKRRITADPLSIGMHQSASNRTRWVPELQSVITQSQVLVMACATKDFINDPTMAEAVGAWLAVDLTT
jgi:hypothetical protein